MSGGETETAVKVVVSGRVQGVWYRGWTVEAARNLCLCGWVRNRRDGTVEALFAGPADHVDQMVEACWHGPPAAQVANVVANVVSELLGEELLVEDDEIQAETGFRQLPTG